ncbi:MAG: hypothetical protein R3A10_22550 [Caldilineaceae bacterium]
MELSIDLTALMLALVVGCLMGTGTYLILRRGQIRLILGLEPSATPLTCYSSARDR